MGWLYYERPSGERDLAHFRREWGVGERLLAGATKGNVFYGALREADGEKVYGIVALIDRFGAGGYNFGYKDMDEGMGPQAAECPERILNLLSPVEALYEEGSSQHKWATTWRERCRESIAKAKVVPKVRKGDLIRFAKPWNFVDGSTEDTFTVVDGRRNRYLGRGDGRLYKLPAKARWGKFEVA